MLAAINLNAVLFMCSPSDLSSTRNMRADAIGGHTDDSKTDEKQGCYSLQLQTNWAHGRRELKAHSCTSFFGRDVKHDCVLTNMRIHLNLHIKEKHFPELLTWISDVAWIDGVT